MIFPGFFQGYGLYLLFSLPALLLGLWAQFKVQSNFSKYSKVGSFSRMSGAEIARRILDYNGLQNVKVEMVNGFLSDHYDPTQRILRLSPDVYQSSSLAAAGVAAHESGHAIQHKEGYLALQLRSAMVPTVQIGSWLGPVLFMIGFFFSSTFGNTLALIGLVLFAAVAVFAIITLPVEFDASRRAKAWLTDTGLLYNEEIKGVNQVLDAAALTYVAAAAQAISTLLYYGFLLLGRRDD